MSYDFSHPISRTVHSDHWHDSIMISLVYKGPGPFTQLKKKGEHEETPGFQNFAVFCPLCIVRGTGVCRTHIEVGHLVVARGTGWG